MNKPFLSVCMIVKNEEKVLNRCLDSIYGIADEIIIVDTGSTDKSKEIALKYSPMVFDYKWENDFSKARNFAASKATGEWILVIDADEYVDRESFLNFKNELKNNPNGYNIYAIQIVNFLGDDGNFTSLNYHDRLYKNDGFISYYRSIHEMLKHKESKERRGISNFQIFHSGYLKKNIIEKEKSKRNLELLRNKKEKEPIDYYFIGNEYDQLGNLEKAIKYYKKGFQLKENIFSDWVIKLLLRLVNTLNRASRNKEALDIINSCEELYPDLVDFKFYRGKIYFENEEYINAKRVLEGIIKEKNKLKAEISIDFLEYLPHKILGEIYDSENEIEQAVYHYSRALSINDTDYSIWSKLINLLAKHSSLEELSEFLNKKLLAKKHLTPQRVIKILHDVPNLNVQKLTRSLLEEQELSNVEKEALLIKNLCLDGSIEEVISILNERSRDQIFSLLNTNGIFSIIDLIILTIETQNENLQKLINNIKFDQNISNLLGVIFNKHNKKLTNIEEEFFVLIFRQSIVLGWDNVINHLNKKVKYLSFEAKSKIMRINKKENQNLLSQKNEDNYNENIGLNRLFEKIIYLISNNLYQEALPMLDEALDIDPINVELYSMKAVCLINLQQLDSAKKILKKGLEINPDYVDCLYNLAFIYEQKNQLDIANELYMKILNVTNEEELKSEILEKLNLKDKKILIGSPIHQKPQILEHFIKSLSILNKEGLDVHYLFIDDNISKESSLLLKEFSEKENNVIICKSNFNDEYIRNEQTHLWNEHLIWKVANFKDSIIQVANEFNFDYLFLIDSDLVLHPNTLKQLLMAKRDIISNIFWTKWQPDFPELPQVWMFDQYEQYNKIRGEQLSKEQILERHKEFINMLKKPGVYEVGGLGACTLISKKAIKAGVSFKEIKNISLWGEDRHFCVRAAALGFTLYVDTHYPAYHIYRESDLENVKDFFNTRFK